MRRIENVQALRGIAALMVLFIHAIAAPTANGAKILLPWAEPVLGRYGPAGVDIFFVISGFIIMTVANAAGVSAPGGGNLALARDFALKRFLRIYPVYWCAFLFALAVRSAVVLSPPGYGHVPIGYQLFMLHPINDVVMAAWSLTYEIYFYFIVTLALIFFPKNIFRAVAIWSVVSVILIGVAQLTGPGKTWASALPFHPIIVEFMFGVLVAYLVHRKIIILALPALVLGLVLFFVGAEINYRYFDWDQRARLLCTGLPALLVVYGLICLELQGTLVLPRTLRRVGDASYSIYIWHQPVLYSLFAASVYTGLLNSVPAVAQVLVSVAVVVAVGFASYRYLETPVNQLGRRLTGPGRTPAAPSNWRALVQLPNLLFVAAMVALPVATSIGVAKFKTKANETKENVLASTTKVKGYYSAEDLTPPPPGAAYALAEWPVRAGTAPLVFLGAGDLAQSAALELPPWVGFPTIDLRLDAGEAGAVYVAYKSNGAFVEKWHEVPAGRSLIRIKIDRKLDDGKLWLVRETTRGSVKLETAVVAPAKTGAQAVPAARQAEWPERAGMAKLDFNGTADLNVIAAVDLPAGFDLPALDVRLDSAAAGAFYVGYQSSGATVEKWVNFDAGPSLLSVKLEKKIDGGKLWVVRDGKRGATRLESLVVSASGG